MSDIHEILTERYNDLPKKQREKVDQLIAQLCDPTGNDLLEQTKLPCDIQFINGKVGKGCSLRTLQLRILNHGRALTDEITRLRAEVEALREDAERYRWIADNCEVHDEYGVIEDETQLDAARKSIPTNQHTK